MDDPSLVDSIKNLDAEIEQSFSEQQKQQRQSLFERLENYKYDEILIYKSSKLKQEETTANYTSSEYIGVSPSGYAWQIGVMLESKMVNLCQVADPETGSQIYDSTLIQNKGFKVKVNKNYSKAHLLAILLEKSFVNIVNDFKLAHKGMKL